MKVSVNRDVLLAACQTVLGAVATKTTRPILTNVKMVCDEDSLTIMGTDMEVGMRNRITGVEIDRTGSAIIPVAKLVQILRETSDSTITLNADRDSTMIRLSTGKYTLPGMDPAEFPDVTGQTDGPVVTIQAGTLQRIFQRAKIASEKKELTRWAITGVMLECKETGVTAVGTDTKTLVTADAIATVAAELHGKSAILPIKAVALLDKCINFAGDEVHITLGNSEATFTLRGITLVTKLVEGRFPPYSAIIPKKLAHTVQLHPPTFGQRVRQAAIMSDKETCRVSFEFEMGTLILRAQGDATGKGEVSLEVPDFQGKPASLALDPEYVNQMIRSVDGAEMITMEFVGSDKPVVFRVGDDYLCLIMPMGE